MNLSTSKSINASPSPQWIAFELIGGPFAGQTMTLPADQHKVELTDNGRRHVYHRPGPRAVLYHDGGLAKLIGGRL